MDDLTDCGYIYRTHGYKGAMRVRLHDHINLTDTSVETIYLGNGPERLPYFPVEFRLTGTHELLMQCEDIDSKEAAAALKGAHLYLPAGLVKTSDASRDLTGYTVSDRRLGRIGPVLRIDTYPLQEILIVQYGDREVLIPFQDAWLEHIDDANRELLFDLPEGLLDI